MEKHKKCAIFGHRTIEVTNELKAIITDTLKNMIEKEFIFDFYFGGFGEFDNLCWQIVSNLRKSNTCVRRIFCLLDPKHKNPLKRPKWLNSGDYEEFIYLDLDCEYWYTRIYYRNCEIINHSDYIIFYVKNNYGGAYKAMQYAIKQNKPFVNIAILNHNHA